MYPRGEVLRQQSKIQYIVYKENLLVQDKNKSKVNIRTEISHTHSSCRAQVAQARHQLPDRSQTSADTGLPEDRSVRTAEGSDGSKRVRA